MKHLTYKLSEVFDFGQVFETLSALEVHRLVNGSTVLDAPPKRAHLPGRSYDQDHTATNEHAKACYAAAGERYNKALSGWLEVTDVFRVYEDCFLEDEGICRASRLNVVLSSEEEGNIILNVRDILRFAGKYIKDWRVDVLKATPATLWVSPEGEIPRDMLERWFKRAGAL